MSTDTGKKRKREDVDAEYPRKSRTVGDKNVGKHIDGNGVVKKAGKSRQEKSERRSKKVKKERGVKTKQSEAHKTESLPTPVSTGDAKDTLASGEDFIPLSDVPTVSEKATKQTKGKKEKKEKDDKAAKKVKKLADGSRQSGSRFIVFVGNLPYHTTTAQIEAHFAKLSPFVVRHRVDKSTGQGRGFAFLEFEEYDKMKTCLQLYHHSIFDPAAKEKGDLEGGSTDGSDARKGRRINVELTAGGGGGKSQGRKDKIKTKNKKLEEEREKRRAKEKTDQGKAVKGNKEKPAAGANVEEGPETDDRGTIHPSRMKQVRH